MSAETDIGVADQRGSHWMENTPTRRKAWFGWCMYDWANSAFATVIMAAVFPVYFAALVPEGGAVLPIPGLNRAIPATALWGYVIACSMLLVALSAPQIGAFADRRGSRRRLLIICTLVGAAATTMLSATRPGDYLMAGGLFILANFGFATANIFYNSFLPALAPDDQLDRLSSYGFALGYIGGGLALALVFIMIQWYEFFGFADQAGATRAGFLLTGAWWALFAMPAFFWLRESALPKRPSPLLSGFRQYVATFAEIRRYPQLFLFLIAFLCYNDGIQTVIVVSAIFGKEELGLSQGTILACFLMIQFLAMPGTLFFGRIAEKWGARRSILITLVLFIGITIYAFFMQTALEFWILAAVVALIFGGSQAVSRSLYGSLIPQEKAAEFFGFYAISNKFASILGPLTFGVIADITGSARLSILALVVFFITGIVLLRRVDVAQGQALARGEPS